MFSHMNTKHPKQKEIGVHCLYIIELKRIWLSQFQLDDILKSIQSFVLHFDMKIEIVLFATCCNYRIELPMHLFENYSP